MVVLNCPLCCTETFPTTSALKSHILEILDNLACFLCGEKFGKVADLADHLDECSDSAVEVQVAEEGCAESGAFGESILARALLDGAKTYKEETEGCAEYFCQSCDVHFDDIDDHLREFHEGQEIILEQEEALDTADKIQDKTSLLLLLDESQTTPAQTTPPKKQTAPITTQDIKDKDGRLYTRKFVKIDKFWLENKTQTDDAQIEKYILDDNDVSVIEEEAKEDSNSNGKKIMEVTLCDACNCYYPSDGDPHACDKRTKKIHACEICNTPFPTFKSLRLHKRMHEPIKQREIEAPANYDDGEESVRQMFVCRVCHKTYDKEYETVHMTSHDCSNGYNCDVCNRKFFTQSNLEMHMKAHSNNKKFTCSYCKKPFVTYDSLNDHLVNQCQKRAYACQYCGRRFTRPHEKVKHERIHTGEKPHVCDICGKAFRVSYCLTLHMRTHSGTRPYQCAACGKRFKSHSVYNHHLLTHSDVRAYKCPFCPKAFKTSVQLAGHKNSHIKPFTCTECNRPFASLYSVRAHMETHKRDNNLKYECWMCGALYSRAFALRDHLKQQHQQVDGGEKARAEVVGVEEELEAAGSILVNEEDIILGLEGAASIEIIENEGE